MAVKLLLLVQSRHHPARLPMLTQTSQTADEAEGSAWPGDIRPRPEHHVAQERELTHHERHLSARDPRQRLLRVQSDDCAHGI
eukprot:21130-Hanusia_phi.AAC.8